MEEIVVKRPEPNGPAPRSRSLARELRAIRRHSMPIWKWAAMHGYYGLTSPLRKLRMSQLSAEGHAPVVVLLYHRVAYDWANEWTTHTDSFIAGLRWLEQRFEMVSLSEAQRRVRSGCNHRPCATVTFDDGYAENADVALPLLAEERIPCTYFVSAEAVLEGKPFEHDLAMGNDFRPNTVEELRHFAAEGIEIGAHTRTHPNIAQVTDGEELYDEIVRSRDDLQMALDAPIRWFAFPFGQHEHLKEEAIQMAAGAGFDGVVSAYGGYNFPGDDDFHLQRIGVDGPVVRLKNWALLDPFKQLRMQRFEYSLDG